MGIGETCYLTTATLQGIFNYSKYDWLNKYQYLSESEHFLIAYSGQPEAFTKPPKQGMPPLAVTHYLLLAFDI